MATFYLMATKVWTVASTLFLSGSVHVSPDRPGSGERVISTPWRPHPHEGCFLAALMVASVGLLDTNNGSLFRLITLWNPLLSR